MKVLIAYDGSANSESALVDLKLAGLPSGTQALVLSVQDDRASDSDGSAAEELQQGGEGGDRGAVAEKGSDAVRKLFPSWTVTAEVRVGSPAWEIIKCAEGEGGAAGKAPFDLVVVGSRSRSVFKRLLLGSVAHRVVTTLRGSVRVSRGSVDRISPQPGSGVAAPPRLVLGVDGSPDAHAAVQAVASRSWPIGTRLVVATFEPGPLAMAFQQVPNTIWGGSPLLPDSPSAVVRPALRVASEAAEVVRRRYPDLSITTLVQPADPKYGLLGAAEIWDKDGADCIFVGASGVRGIDRFLVGSVSTSVALNATCSVEIVRHSS